LTGYFLLCAIRNITLWVVTNAQNYTIIKKAEGINNRREDTTIVLAMCPVFLEMIEIT